MNESEVKRMIQSCIVTEKKGMTMKQLYGVFREETGMAIPYQRLGYPNLMALLETIPGLRVMGENAQGDVVLSFNALGSSMGHIQEFVRSQNKKGGSKGAAAAKFVVKKYYAPLTRSRPTGFVSQVPRYGGPPRAVVATAPRFTNVNRIQAYQSVAQHTPAQRSEEVSYANAAISNSAFNVAQQREAVPEVQAQPKPVPQPIATPKPVVLPAVVQLPKLPALPKVPTPQPQLPQIPSLPKPSIPPGFQHLLCSDLEKKLVLSQPPGFGPLSSNCSGYGDSQPYPVTKVGVAPKYVSATKTPEKKSYFAAGNSYEEMNPKVKFFKGYPLSGNPYLSCHQFIGDDFLMYFCFRTLDVKLTREPLSCGGSCFSGMTIRQCRESILRGEIQVGHKVTIMLGFMDLLDENYDAEKTKREMAILLTQLKSTSHVKLLTIPPVHGVDARLSIRIVDFNKWLRKQHDSTSCLVIDLACVFESWGTLEMCYKRQMHYPKGQQTPIPMWSKFAREKIFSYLELVLSHYHQKSSKK